MHIERVRSATCALVFCALSLGCGEAKPDEGQAGGALQGDGASGDAPGASQDTAASTSSAQPVAADGNVATRRLEDTQLDLTKCQDTECEPMGTDRPDVTVREERTCKAGRPVDIELAWSEVFLKPVDAKCDTQAEPCFPQPSELDCEGFGRCTLMGFSGAVGADGTLWVVAAAGEPLEEGAFGLSTRAGVWLSHRDRDGSDLGSRVVFEARAPKGEYVSYDAQLTVDERGHVFLAATKVNNEILPGQDGPPPDPESFIAEFDDEGEQVGGVIDVELPRRVEFGGGRLLVQADGKGHVIIGQSQLVNGGLAFLSTDTREVSWVQSRNRHIGFLDLAHDGKGRTTLLTQSPDFMASGRIEQFDADGRLAWERTLPWRSMRFDYSAPGLGVDSEGHLYTAGLTSGAEEEAIGVHKLARDGSSLEIIRIEPQLREDDSFGYGRGYSTMDPVFAPDGRLFVNGGTYNLSDGQGNPLPSKPLIYELSADTKSCRVLRWDTSVKTDPRVSVMEADRLYALDDGSLYFTGQSGFGRLQP